jgi:hypothetical protein
MMRSGLVKKDRQKETRKLVTCKLLTVTVHDEVEGDSEPSAGFIFNFTLSVPVSVPAFVESNLCMKHVE